MSETKHTIGHFVLGHKIYQTFCILVDMFALSLNDKLSMGAKPSTNSGIVSQTPASF